MKSIVLTTIAASLLAVHAAGLAATVPIEHFFDKPEFSAAELSPDARYLALP